MRWAVAAMGLLLLVAFQAVIAPYLVVAGTVPDLPLVAVLVIGLLGGPTRGGLAGVWSGLALDLLHGTHIGLFSLATGTVGWLCGEAAARVDAGRAIVRWVIATLAAALYGAAIAGLWRLLGNPVALHGALHHVLAGALYDGLLAALICWPLSAAARRRALGRSRYRRPGPWKW